MQEHFFRVQNLRSVENQGNKVKNECNISLINIQGLTDIKVLELTDFINNKNNRCHMLCITETHHRYMRARFPKDFV